MAKESSGYSAFSGFNRILHSEEKYVKAIKGDEYLKYNKRKGNLHLCQPERLKKNNAMYYLKYINLYHKI